MSLAVCCRHLRKKNTEILDTSLISSTLHLEGKDPKRLKPLQDLYFLFQKTLLDSTNFAISSLTKLSSSISDVFYVEKIFKLIKTASFSTLASYGFSGYVGYQSLSLSLKKTDLFQACLCFAYLGYASSFNVTHKKPQIFWTSLLDQMLVLISILQLHILSFKATEVASNAFFQPQVKENYISDDTATNLNILIAIIGSFAILPAVLLNFSKLVFFHSENKKKQNGELSQVSRSSPLQIGINEEFNKIMHFYEHFNAQLKDPARLFQYFIVALNVLRDGTLEAPTPNSSRFVQKTRNMWLLALDSFIKAKSDLEARFELIKQDKLFNQKKFNIIRNGKRLHQVSLFELKQGDLVSLDQALNYVKDPLDGTIKTHFKLSGYLIDLDQHTPTRSLVVSLVALNGESKPLLVIPSKKVKTKQELLPCDLFSIMKHGTAITGVELIGCENTQNFYLQIAQKLDERPHYVKKTPFISSYNLTLKNRLIYASLAFSLIGAIPLIRFRPISTLKKFMQFYGTQGVDKFTQVFSETQTLIPLVSEVALEMVNASLLKELNRGLKKPLTEHSALSVCDLFEFLLLNKVKIFSDKTGTVTETAMHARALIVNEEKGSMQDFIEAFAVTFSDQKTEEEENEVKRFIFEKHKVKIIANLSQEVPNGHQKQVFFPSGRKVEFESLRLGLFHEFGGVFSLKKQNKTYEIVFSGIPKAYHQDVVSFEDTPLYEDFTRFESDLSAQLEEERSEVLTRDWALGKASISEDEYQALKTAYELENKDLLIRYFHQIKLRLQYLGIFLIDNPIKPFAKEAIFSWKQAGIDFVLITGDTKKAALKIAPKLLAIDRVEFLDKTSFDEDVTLFEKDLSNACVIYTDTCLGTLEQFSKLLKKPSDKPFIIFCQMKDVDKKKITQEGKKDAFIIASGDGANDILMFEEAHLAIASSQHDGSFSQGLEEKSTFTDLQLNELFAKKEVNLYRYFDIHRKKDSRFLKKFAKLANTQPKVITALLAKPLKSFAAPRVCGFTTRQIPFQFASLLCYDALFLMAIHHFALQSSKTPLVKERIYQAKLPLAILATSVAIASLQASHLYFQNQTITSYWTLGINFVISSLALKMFLSPPGFKSQ